MIAVREKSRCCGCAACQQICPRLCIGMRADSEGFLYPYVDESACVNCGLCEKVCPELHQNGSRKPIKVYAAVNPDEEVRRQSSSGGIFTLLAEKIIDDGGVVFGARFDENWTVVHDYTETKDGLAAFRGSKYVQSRIGSAYRQAQKFLRAGRKVLFSGTPCQIAGLKSYLRNDYDNLLAVDFVCHGVPSPEVWRCYLEEVVRPKGRTKKFSFASPKPPFSKVGGLSSIKAINFRNKDLGWKKYSFALTLSKATAEGEKTQFCSHVFTENPFMQAFLANLILRPSCYNCPSKAGKSGSDITIGDFWGIENIMPEFDDDKGCSLVMVNDEKAMTLLRSLPILHKETDYPQAIAGNPSIENAVSIPVYRKFFWRQYKKKGSFISALDDRFSMKLWKKMKRLWWKKTSHPQTSVF